MGTTDDARGSDARPDGHLALPASGEGPGVLVLHAWWGLDDTMKSVCARLADAGFVAFAPDLYHGEVTGDASEADALSSALFEDLDRPREDVADALAFLATRANRTGGGLAVVGFSLGAFFALDVSVTAPEEVRRVVVFYGTKPGDYEASRADYLGHFAEHDDFEPPAEVDALEASLERAGRPVTFHRYPGTGHWFFESGRADAYDEAAAAKAWERTVAFLRGAGE